MSSTYQTGMIFLLGFTAVYAQFPPALSQYRPLSASRDPSYFENPIEREVGGVLSRLPYFGVFDHLAYRVDGNMVTLSGEVLNPELRSGAQLAVSTIAGVNYVNNEITFLSVSPPENQLRKAVFAAIYANPSLLIYTRASGGKIHIVVHGSRVTLEGEVSSASDRQRAGDLTKAVHGVSSVVNHLSVSD